MLIATSSRNETRGSLNSLTNETRRFQRSFILDDLWGGQSLTIIANEQPLTVQEAQVFEETIQNSRVTFKTFPRDPLDGHSGLSGRDSVVGDLTSGRLSGGLLSGLQAYLLGNGYAGAPSHVSAEFGLELIFSYNASVNLDDLRTQPLTVRITYPDASSLQIKLSPDLDEVMLISGVDAKGNEIVFEPTGDGAPPPVVPVGGIEYSFGTANPSWGNVFGTSLDALDSYTCSSWTTEAYVIVLCSRQ